MMNNLEVASFINNWPSDLDGHLHYCIGLSGGIDSVVLLHLFNSIAKFKPIKVSAIHVNHGLSPNADSWANFCSQLCAEMGIVLTIAKVKVEKIGGEGLENSARKLRYKQYAQTSADVMVLAHHQDDQLETMLSQIMRGSDLHNSAGMLNISIKNHQKYWRPLLNVSKRHILDYAKKHQLLNIEDESNQDNHYLRNFIRNSIMPQLENYDANIKQKLLQSVREIQRAVTLMDELAKIDLSSCQENATVLNRERFCNLSQSRQINLLTYWLKTVNIPLPSSRKINELTRQINNAHYSKKPFLQINNQVSITVAKKMIELSNTPKDP